MRHSVIILVALFISACTTPRAPEPQETPEGRNPRSALCISLQQFVRARLGPEALRKAVFLPAGRAGSAVSMIATPVDPVSKAFERGHAGRLARRLRAPRFAALLSGCLASHDAFTTLEYSRDAEYTHASFEDRSTERRIEISATGGTTTVLITADPDRVRP